MSEAVSVVYVPAALMKGRTPSSLKKSRETRGGVAAITYGLNSPPRKGTLEIAWRKLRRLVILHLPFSVVACRVRLHLRMCYYRQKNMRWMPGSVKDRLLCQSDFCRFPNRFARIPIAIELWDVTACDINTDATTGQKDIDRADKGDD